MNLNYNLDYLQKDLNNNIKNLLSNTSNNIELECVFNNTKYLTQKKYIQLLNFLNIKYKTDTNKFKLIKDISLDISYQYTKEVNKEENINLNDIVNNLSNYRITLNGLEFINSHIDDNLKERYNHVIFSYFCNQILNGNIDNKYKDNISIINKIKSNDKLIVIPEFDFRIRLSQENPINNDILKKLTNLDHNERFNIIFRYKNRVSLILIDNEDYTLRLDLTDVKQNNNLLYINESFSRYEFELDLSLKKPFNNIKTNIIKEFETYLLMSLKQLQSSSVLCSELESNDIKKKLISLSYNDEIEIYKDMKDLPAMQTITAEIIHIVDRIPNKYSLTDKADGERTFLIIFNDNVYLINNNLEIKNITPNNINKNKLNDYNGTIIDGEYVFIKKYKKYLFLGFDILFVKDKDIRNELILYNRIQIMKDVLNDIFKCDYKIDKYEDNFDIKKILKYYTDEITYHFNNLNKKLNNSKDNNIIMGKFFIFPLGASDYEIYSYSDLFWDLCTKNSNIACPYELDGLVYTPLQQKYTRSMKDTKYPILKWKPETHNSLDFYITFERDSITNKILNVYDFSDKNSLDNYINKTDGENINDDVSKYKTENYYRIINLQVGRFINKKETPVPFQEAQDNSKAYIYIKDDNIYDVEGNIIQDKTVVEFTYKNDLNIPEKFRWIPLRTRYDKTESVIKYKRKYGNSEYTANSVWNSMQNIVSINDIKLLGDPKTSDDHFKLLKTRVSTDIINQENRGNAYYQIVSEMGKNMDQFHSFIKSNLFDIYCKARTTIDNKKLNLDVLDIGIGRGGDLMKYYHARVKSCIGFDVDDNNINSAGDSCTSRYNTFKKKYPGFPNMTFLIADGGAKLNLEDQKNAIGKMSEQNMKNISSIFGENSKSKNYRKFDLISSQFMIHYLFKNQTTWDNLCFNINKFLKNYGYMMITCFDGEEVEKTFDKDGHIKAHFINDNNEEKLLFDIVRKYPKNSNLDSVGLAIDMFNCSFMLEGTYQTEYLVTPTFLINNLKKSCNMRLVETDTFENLFNTYNEFFNSAAETESVTDTKNYFLKVKKFYDKTDDNKNWFNFSRLNRYYIFQKYE